MSSYLTLQQFVRLGAVAFLTLVLAMALIQSRPREGATALTPLEPAEADNLVRELARCRTAKPDDAPVLEACRRLWAENRRHFFTVTNSPRLSDQPAPELSAAFKSQERVPQPVDEKIK